MFAISAAPYVGLKSARDEKPAAIRGEKRLLGDVVVGHGVGRVRDESEGAGVWVNADGRNMAVVGDNMN